MELFWEKLEVGELQTNCYLLKDGEGGAVLIDPGGDPDYLAQVLSERNLKLLEIWATHGHFDHLLAAPQLQLIYQVPLFLHPKDLFLARDLGKRAEYWLKCKVLVEKLGEIREIKEGEKLKLGRRFEFLVMETPGHTPGGLCFWEKKEGLLFSGDTLFRDGVGRADFSYSRPAELQKSLKRIMKLPGGTRVLPGHGEEIGI